MQISNLVTHGIAFLHTAWYVMDLVIVCVSLVCETVLEDTAKGWLAPLAVLRLWNVVAFIFDVLFANNESTERNKGL